MKKQDQKIINKRKEEIKLNNEEKSKKVAHDYTLKQKERSYKMKVHIENEKKEKMQTLEKIIEETHNAEDTSVDFVAQDLVKQSTDLQKRLAERRKHQRSIQSCKNGGGKSFFQFESSNLGNKNDKVNISNLPNISIIKRDGSDTENDESFSMDIFNKGITAPHSGRNLRIDTSLSDEEEEEESEDEALDNNLKEIWNECEKVFETLQGEKEEATTEFIEDFTTKKFERIAELKTEMKIKITEAPEEEKYTVEDDYNQKLRNLEEGLKQEKDVGLSDIKKKFYRRKQSIVGKMDVEGAKSRLKATLYSKNMSFMSTSTSQSFYLSPNEPSNKAQRLDGMVNKDYNMKPYQQLVSPNAILKAMPKTPNKMVKIDFGLTDNKD
mmetsp:Transcript_17339/g.19410  ORF Transcript_17339/g.19410 Transcript_17339/m.19410 type:complete len:381 (+) Transcript_17339:309-1451(+)|eukprot:CAMPEP_0205811384 /NCGR_PEP_ID=MMETSP0205-20121125/15567_1 /ASSEMBLY_ACC=CAM_ASM_000278 /TAXON_ID=36767 /ORGANISM="Euplotes focardii, Strain TN1" /LENGTH=380 /DNA_ID=CAMNT_0053090467 /DNA_START=263 /DNA_END=1405 /DNA_ORIENTATION=-